MGIDEPVSLETVVKTMPHASNPIAPSKLKKGIERCVENAFDKLEQARQVEGRALVLDIHKRLRVMAKKNQSIEKRIKRLSKRTFKELKQRINDMVGEAVLESSRMEAEVAMLVEKSDVTEELVRLQSHIKEFEKILHNSSSQKGIGRKLDFFTQEMNREINTIGSKIGDAQITGQVVQLKSELEKIREQIQNIE